MDPDRIEEIAKADYELTRANALAKAEEKATQDRNSQAAELLRSARQRRWQGGAQ